MTPSEGPNPERRSNNAILCFCIGVGAIALAQFLGMSAVIGAAIAGTDPAVAIGSVAAVIGVALLGVAGFVLAAIGGVWMLVQVIADQRGEPGEQRYRDIER
ncbi:MAG: hypothetical protein R3C25_12445 [Hyphomonadaceae bacterium]